MTALSRLQIAGMNQHYRRFSFDYFLESQARAGYKNIELWCGAPHYHIDPESFESCKTMKKRVLDRGLKIVSVTIPSFQRPYQCAAQPGSPFKQSFKYFANGIRATAELGCSLMTLNSGWGLHTEYPGEAWKRSAEMISSLCRVAEGEGVTLVLESLRNDESNIVFDLASAKKMFDAIDNSCLKMMVDTIAMGAAGETLDDWFDTFGPDLRHMHFLDGNPYVHAIWGDGSYPLEAMLGVLCKRGYKGYLVQEIADDKYFSDPANADIRSMRVLERFFSEKVQTERIELMAFR